MEPGLGFRTSVAWMVWASAFIGALNFAALLVFARVLGPTQIAVYGSAVVGLELIWALLSFGFNQAVIRQPKDDALYAAAFLAVVIQAAIFSLFALAVAYATGSHSEALRGRHTATWVGLAIARVATLVATLLYAHQEASLQYRPIALAQLWIAMATNLIAITVVSVVPDVLVIVCRDIAAGIVTLVWSLKFPHYRRPRVACVTREAVSRLTTFSWRMWGLNASERLAQRIDYLIVGFAMGMPNFGIYYAIRSLMEGVLAFLIRPVQTTVYAYYCRAEEKKTALQGQLSIVLPAIVSATVIAVIGAWEWGGEAVDVSLGGKYLIGHGALLGLAVYCGCVVWFEFNKVLAMAMGLHHLPLFGRLCQVVIVILFAMPMIDHWQFFGAGLMTGLAGAALASVTSGLLVARIFRRRVAAAT